MERKAVARRTTNETDIQLELVLDGKGVYDISTGIGFLDHMLSQVIRHGFMDLKLSCKGDLEIDCHHTAEDIGIALGRAANEALGGKEGIRRYGSAFVPMEDSLALCVMDFSGRPYLSFEASFPNPRIGDLDSEMIEEFFRAFSVHSGCDLHIKLLSGKNGHHMAEAIFKAFGKAMDMAVSLDPRIEGSLSTKGMLE
ncbi:MAG: imidazoleglycerol-phosphate dehydratase HisB [Clostridiales bacterium]|jgi:imidazoleglycerol-phosphate dehydratase|nr:imidazoleglycerol-phosphate dehydratase HisB [Clostridiales bacterium]